MDDEHAAHKGDDHAASSSPSTTAEAETEIDAAQSVATPSVDSAAAAAAASGARATSPPRAASPRDGEGSAASPLSPGSLSLSSGSSSSDDERARSRSTTSKAFQVLGSIPNSSKVKARLGLEHEDDLTTALSASRDARQLIQHDVLDAQRRENDELLVSRAGRSAAALKVLGVDVQQAKVCQRLGVDETEYTDAMREAHAARLDAERHQIDTLRAQQDYQLLRQASDSTKALRLLGAEASNEKLKNVLGLSNDDELEAVRSSCSPRSSASPRVLDAPSPDERVPAEHARDSEKALKMLGVASSNPSKLKDKLGLSDSHELDAAMQEAAASRAIISHDVLDVARAEEDERLLAEVQHGSKVLRMLDAQGADGATTTTTTAAAATSTSNTSSKPKRAKRSLKRVSAVDRKSTRLNSSH